MGKKRKNSQRKRKEGGKPKNFSWKRQRREKYWIEDCRETKGVDPADAALTLLITRTELTDSHSSNPKCQDSSNVTNVTRMQSTAQVKDPPEQDPQQNESSVTEEKPIGNNSFEASKTEPTAETRDATEENTPDSPLPSEASKKISDVDTNKVICIRRDASAKTKPKKFSNPKFEHLPDGDCGDGVKNPFPKHVVADKYWAQRHRLFSRFDEGIQLDMESWYSVTPEAIANHIAAKMVEPLVLPSTEESGLVVLDAFCGAGGNAIAFARQTKVSLVVCVDLDEAKLKLAAQNAKIYEIPSDKLLFIHADAFDVLAQYRNGTLLSSPGKTNDQQQVHGYRFGKIDLLPISVRCIFLSPPWGGVQYEDIGPKKYDLKCIKFDDGEDGENLIRHAVSALPPNTGTIACFLPRNTNALEVGKSALLAGISGTMEVEQNVLNNKFKAVTIYMGKTDKNTENITSDQS